MDTLHETKVGDRLFIKTGYYDKGRIVSVDRVTPSGRVITKAGEFNPNGRRRGDHGFNTTWAVPASEDHVAGVYRYGLVSKIERFRAWDKLSADDLKIAGALVDKYNLPR